MKANIYIKDKKIQSELNSLLSDYQMHYQNLRAFHWLVKGPQFFQLHGKFEEMYNQAAEAIDEIAERIMMVGGKPLHSFADYLENAGLKAEKDLDKAEQILPVIIENKEYLLGKFREILELAGNNDDEGTASLMSDFIGEAEKELWMLKSLQG